MIESRKIKNPFPGLRPFETDEYRLFFGREGQSDALIARLQRSHFLAVVGTSGSGKSSLVRAGLLPALRGGLMAGAGSGWRIAIMRPGSDPIGNLALALADKEVLLEAGGALPPAEAGAVIEATLRRGSLGLVDVARQARLAEHEKLLVVVDQFEELFRFRAARPPSSTGDDASAFVKLLLEASQQLELSIYVVPTMRSDFLGDCAQFQGLPEAINDGQYLIPRMTRDERRFAITGPVGVTRGKITEPLVNRLMNDVGDNPDQLPILQHALMRTWDYWATHRRNGEPIGLQHYAAVGTMSDALSEHADEAFNELPDERSRLIAELLFKALTERGADNREIRRPTCLQDICDMANAHALEVGAVIEVFRGGGRSFLMPPAGVALEPETVIDISHESLIRNWLRLKDWVNEEAQSARIYRRLAEAAVLHREGSEGLLQDPGLQLALDWREKHQPTAAWARRYHPEFDEALFYLKASHAARDAAVAERERQREEQIARERRELEQAQVYAEQQRRAARRLRRLSVALGLIMLLALGTAGYAFSARADALRSRKAAEDSAQAADAEKKQAVMAAKAAKASEKTALEAKEHAATEEARAEKEAERANEQATIAEENARSAQLAVRQANIAKGVAEEKTLQVAGALERGELIRGGLESFRREDFKGAKEAFIQLHDKLKPFQPGAPSSAGNQSFTPEQSRQFVNDYGWTLSHLGDTHHKLSDFEASIEAYEKARVILEAVLKNDKSAPILFETYYGLAHAYHDKANAPTRAIKPNNEEQFTKAEKFYIKALAQQKPQAAENPLVAVPGYKNLAQLYIETGKFKEAEDNLKLVVDAYTTVEYRPGAGTVGALKELAEFYRGQSRYPEAAQTYNDLIDLQEGGAVESGEGLRARADNYSELGQVYTALKDEKRADDTFKLVDKLQQIALKVKHKGSTLESDAANTTHDNDLDELGDIYLKMGRFSEAKRSYEMALSGRNEVETKKASLGTSYLKLANLYRDHFNRPDQAEEYYKLLIEARKDAGDQAGNTFSDELRQYVEGLRQLGALYSGEINKPAEAEVLFNRALSALGPVHSRLAWEDIEGVYSALLDLYRGQQNKQRELEQTYARKLEAMTKLHQDFISGSYRTEEYPPFMVAYFKTVGEVVAFYLEQKNTDGAGAVYRQAFAKTETSFIERLHDPKQLDDMASALEKGQPLLRELKLPDEAAKLEVLIKKARARQKELETRQKEIEELRQQQESQKKTPQAPTKP